MPARYQWREPKAAKGDRVTFVDQYGHPGEGEVVKVTTTYRAEGRAGVQRAQHTYSVHRGGRRRRVNVGDQELLQVTELGICATILKIMESEPLRHWTFLDVALRLKGKSSQSVIEAMRELLTHGVIEAQNQHGTPSFRVRRNAGAAA